MIRLLALLAFCGVAWAGCNDAGCIKTDDPSCRMPSPCQKLGYQCEASDGRGLELRRLDGTLPAPGGEAALPRKGDVLLGNDRVVAVIAGLGNQNYLDLSGGSILDLQPRGRDADAINQIVTAVGILPRDSVEYTTMQLIDERPRRIGVQVAGTLYQQPATRVVTLFEVRPCEPGIRVRSVLYNGTPDPQAWSLTDGWYWSGRSPIPFTPGKGRGFFHPSFDLLTINDAFERAPYMAASTHSTPTGSYGEIGCQLEELEGFQSVQVSTFGMPRTVIPPRGVEIFERFIVAGERGDAASAIDLLAEARTQLFKRERWVTVSGRVDAPSPPLGTARSESQLSLLIAEGEAGTIEADRTPVTQVVPLGDGRFSARVPAGRDYVLSVRHFGHTVEERAFAAADADVDLGSFTAPQTARVRVRVTNALAVPLDAEVFVVPADDATRAASAGSFYGQGGTCAPWLGTPFGPSPACNRFLVWHALGRPVEVEITPGRYDLYAFHGPFFTIARTTVELTAGADVPLDFELRPLGLQPQGTVSGDLHVHGAASFDSSIPDWDRVLSFAATGMDVIIATDHDVVYDYAAMAQQLDLTATLSTVSGVETTGHVPFMRIPDYGFPLVIGHYNFWPLRYDPTLPRNGGPFDELLEPGELFDRVEPLYSGTSLVELNHPWAEPEFGRDLGFPRALSLDLRKDLPLVDDGTSGGMYVRAPAAGHANDDHHAQEVMNGSANDQLLQYRAFWWYLLNQGRPKTGTANSDSHSLTDNTIGTPRNLVYTSTVGGPAFDIDRFNEALRAGRALGTNGPVIEASIVDAPDGGNEIELPYSMAPITARSPTARLRIVVTAAPWVPVDEVRIIVNGKQALRLGADKLAPPGDPFGTAGVMRLTEEIPLATLLSDLRADVDAWIVVEAGAPLPLAADLGGGLKGEPDGMPDTGDNNGDGVVDQRDIEEGKSFGPLKTPPAPSVTSPLYHFFQVTGGYPFAFTNAFLLDRNGNGSFDFIGVGGGR